MPSPLLAPGMAPSVSGPTACAIGKATKQFRAKVMRSDRLNVRDIFMVCSFWFEFIFLVG
jgi:hypothetical protein